MALIPFMVYDWEKFLGSSSDRIPLLRLNSRSGHSLSSSPKTARKFSDSSNATGGSHDELDELRDVLGLATRCYESLHAPSVINKNDFQVMLDVQHFKPEEIEVKVVDNCLVVTAKHEDKLDEHGWVSRQFVRRYQLPEDINVENLTSKLSADGFLTIVAPKKQSQDETERIIQIEYTGKPFVNKNQEKPKTRKPNKKDETAE